MNMKKKITIIFCTIFILITVTILFWRVPIYIKLKTINVPYGCEEIDTKIILSDAYWFHISGERVIKYDGGYEALNSYVHQNNSEFQLKNIEVTPFFVEKSEYAVDIFDVEQAERWKYAVIEYYRKLE